MNFRTITAGDELVLKAQESETRVRFEGFTDWVDQYSETVAYPNWRAVADAKGIKSFKQLDAEQEKRAYGKNVYARFYDLDGKYTFSAGRFNGRWCCGSGADPISLLPTPEDIAKAQAEARAEAQALAARRAQAEDAAAPLFARLHKLVFEGNVEAVKALAFGARSKHQAQEYQFAVEWIAWNDSPGDEDGVNDLQSYVSVALVADIYGVAARTVARDVVAVRKRSKGAE